MSSNEKITLVSKKDLVITWFSGGGGGGGQYKNKHDNCCRIHHPASGATAQSTEHRSALANKKAAFLHLTKHPKFKMWLSMMLLAIGSGQTLEEKVQEMLHPRYLKVEGIVDGQWVELE